LAHVDRATGHPVRRYEHAAPGDLIHVDVKKLGNIPDGGGWRVHGRKIGGRNSQRHPSTTRTRHHSPVLGYSYLHTAIDDHSRLAYTEILADETRQTAVGFWTRAHAWFTQAGITQPGITVRPVLTDNGSCYRSHLWHQTLTAAGSRSRRPARTGRKPTARWSATTAPSPMNGPTPRHTPANQPAAPPCPPGYTCTTITELTPHSTANHPQPRTQPMWT
jgi:hypothetical protein